PIHPVLCQILPGRIYSAGSVILSGILRHDIFGSAHGPVSPDKDPTPLIHSDPTVDSLNIPVVLASEDAIPDESTPAAVINRGRSWMYSVWYSQLPSSC